jgi:hypothetical protein
VYGAKAGAGQGGAKKGRKMFFFEKKNQKTFASWGVVMARR